MNVVWGLIFFNLLTAASIIRFGGGGREQNGWQAVAAAAASQLTINFTLKREMRFIKKVLFPFSSFRRKGDSELFLRGNCRPYQEGVGGAMNTRTALCILKLRKRTR